MKKVIKMLLWAILVLFGSNCTDSQPVRPIDSLGARLVSYDEGGTERTKFGANTFGLSFTNKSDQDVDAVAIRKYRRNGKVKNHLPRELLGAIPLAQLLG